MWTIGAVLLAGLMGGLVALGQTDEQKFFFYWPTETTQCQVSETSCLIALLRDDADEQIIDLTWANATPPFTAYIMCVLSLDC
jgi:hypothetical protein